MKLDIDTSKPFLEATKVRKELSSFFSEDAEEDAEAFRCWATLDSLIFKYKCKQLIKNGVPYTGSKCKYDCAIDINGIDYYPLV